MDSCHILKVEIANPFDLDVVGVDPPKIGVLALANVRSYEEPVRPRVKLHSAGTKKLDYPRLALAVFHLHHEHFGSSSVIQYKHYTLDLTKSQPKLVSYDVDF